MVKKVVRISRDDARIVVGNFPSRRRGKNIGTGKDNRQSSQDKPRRTK